MKDKDCIFCKIAEGSIPSHKIYEDDDVLAFLDIAQDKNPGHTLVISKSHYSSFLTTEKDAMHKVMDVAQRIGQAQISVLGAKGVIIKTHVNKAGGQSVFHFHVHVIPRYVEEDADHLLELKEKARVSELSLPALVDEIKKGL